MRIMHSALFLIVGSLLLTLAHRYLWKRLVRDTGLKGRERRFATGAIVFFGALVPTAMVLGRLVDRSVSGPVSTVAFSWLALFIFLLLSLFTVDLVRFVGRRLRKTPPAPAPGTPDAEVALAEGATRREFLARATAGGALATAGALFAVGAKNALGEIEVVEVPVVMPRLPKALDGFTIVQISDVHIGAMLDGRFLDGVVEKINSQKPDLVVITGDLVDAPPRVIGPDVARLLKLRSRYGSLFVTGNHEYYSDGPEWVAFLSTLGITTLMNERRVIGDHRPGGASFDIAGIPDKQGMSFDERHGQDLGRALLGRDPDRELVLLSHRPNPIAEAAAGGVSLQLSGHTHGGQFFPGTIVGELIHPYNSGLRRHSDGTQIYVSCGTGFWGPPIRLLAPSEITTLRLVAA